MIIPICIEHEGGAQQAAKKLQRLETELAMRGVMVQHPFPRIHEIIFPLLHALLFALDGHLRLGWKVNKTLFELLSLSGRAPDTADQLLDK